MRHFEQSNDFVSLFRNSAMRKAGQNVTLLERIGRGILKEITGRDPLLYPLTLTNTSKNNATNIFVAHRIF